MLWLLRDVVAHWRLGLSDIALLAIFENGHYAFDQVYFYDPSP